MQLHSLCRSTSLLILATVGLFLLAQGPAAAATYAGLDAKARVADLDWLINQISEHYAYLPDRHLDLARMRELYRAQAEQAGSRDAFVHVIERVISELHDHHATLGTNTPSSPQLIPTGTDLWAELERGQAIIDEVRQNSPAAAAGLHAGDVVLTVDGVATNRAIANALPRALTASDPQAADFALRTLLAGTHDAQRRLTVRQADGAARSITLPPYVPPMSAELVTWRRLDRRTGYIRIENSLGDRATVGAFDAALDSLAGVQGLILDLRNTPSGGNTDVAEPILGRFIAHAAPYQRVFDPAPNKRYPQDSWLKTVLPRSPLVTAKLVLVDHWTGSMGEGLAIGFDALQRAKIVGVRMAQLSGGTREFILPNSHIPVDFPTERLYQVNGAPRESFVPPVLVDLVHARTTPDPILERARLVLRGDE